MNKGRNVHSCRREVLTLSDPLRIAGVMVPVRTSATMSTPDAIAYSRSALLSGENFAHYASPNILRAITAWSVQMAHWLAKRVDLDPVT
jgi:hypothetical protein